MDNPCLIQVNIDNKNGQGEQNTWLANKSLLSFYLTVVEIS